MKSKNTNIITSEGELTIAKISDLKEEISKKSQKGEKVVLKIDELKDIDLSGIQLLISIHKYHPDVECEINHVSKNVDDILVNTGMKSLIKK